MKPSSFSVICTRSSAHECKGLLRSIGLFHPGARVYIVCDTATKESIDALRSSREVPVEVAWYVELDQFTHMDRRQMEAQGVWGAFQDYKAHAIHRALALETDTLLIDCDIVLTDVIDDIDGSVTLGVSPAFIRQCDMERVGYYNGGFLWTNSPLVADDWIAFNKTSRYFDQASIDDLVRKYKHFAFGEHYNVQCWRHVLSYDPPEQILAHFTSIADEHRVYYKNQPLKCVHTHFASPEFAAFNRTVVEHLQCAKMDAVLEIIEAITHP